MREIATILLFSVFATAAPSASPVTGTVRNGTTHQPAAGDDVFLLRLDHHLTEEAHSRTDAQGKFAFSPHDPSQPHLVRVIHRNVNYDQPVSSEQALSIQVFDAAESVPGVSGSIEILRAGAQGQQLHVSDMYEIRNESNPPLTEIGERTFEVRLPENAKLDSVFAADPGKTGVVISATPIAGEPGRYAVNVPLRPGATKFAFNYDVPYTGRIAFPTWRSFPMQMFAIMIPSSMSFSSPSPSFRVLPTGKANYQVHAVTQLKAGVGPQFQLSGFGDIPPMGHEVVSRQQSPMLTVPQVITPGPALQDRVGSAPSISPQEPNHARPERSLILIAAAAGTFVAVCLLALRRSRNLRVLSRVNGQRA